MSITGYGKNVWWFYNFNGGLASHFLVCAHARLDVASSSTLQFCAMIYFADESTDITCSPLSGMVGDKGMVTAQLPIDPTKRMQSVSLRLYQEGGASVAVAVEGVEGVDRSVAPCLSPGPRRILASPITCR
ncbi:MAG: hypothetical protein EXS36_04750 [Pedosphaera sp.]|nr:hypothetical protein [Pedosphaera sp.]